MIYNWWYIVIAVGIFGLTCLLPPLAHRVRRLWMKSTLGYIDLVGTIGSVVLSAIGFTHIWFGLAITFIVLEVSSKFVIRYFHEDGDWKNTYWPDPPMREEA